MILTAHQPVYLPWLGLFHKIALSDVFCYFDGVQYQKKDWNNRNRIRLSNGSANWLTVPVFSSGHFEKTINEIIIDNRNPWRRKHWRSIEFSYRKAQYFDLYSNRIGSFYEREWESLTDLNYEMFILFLDILGISVDVIRMNDHAFQGKKGDLVLNMCLDLGADTYVFGELGKGYADVDKFLGSNVVPFFQCYVHPKYPQIHGEFISHLSIIDLLFNCGPQSLEILIAGNVDRGVLEQYAESQRKK